MWRFAGKVELPEPLPEKVEETTVLDKVYNVLDNNNLTDIYNELIQDSGREIENTEEEKFIFCTAYSFIKDKISKLF